MRALLFSALAMIALEGTAIACSCIAAPDDPGELRKMAKDVMNGALALVEIEIVDGYEIGGSEMARVIRVLAGDSPSEFKIARGPFASGASCDITYSKGDHAVVILYSAPLPTGPSKPLFRTSGLCTDAFLQKPAYREEVIKLLGTAKSSGGGERG